MMAPTGASRTAAAMPAAPAAPPAERGDPRAKPEDRSAGFGALTVPAQGSEKNDAPGAEGSDGDTPTTASGPGAPPDQSDGTALGGTASSRTGDDPASGATLAQAAGSKGGAGSGDLDGAPVPRPPAANIGSSGAGSLQSSVGPNAVPSFHSSDPFAPTISPPGEPDPPRAPAGPGSPRLAAGIAHDAFGGRSAVAEGATERSPDGSRTLAPEARVTQLGVRPEPAKGAELPLDLVVLSSDRSAPNAVRSELHAVRSELHAVRDALARHALQGAATTGAVFPGAPGIAPVAIDRAPLGALAPHAARDAGPVAPGRVGLAIAPRMDAPGDGPRRLVVRLHPAALGEVEVEIVRRGGGLLIELRAETAEAVRALDAERAAIEAQMRGRDGEGARDPDERLALLIGLREGMGDGGGQDGGPPHEGAGPERSRDAEQHGAGRGGSALADGVRVI